MNRRRGHGDRHLRRTYRYRLRSILRRRWPDYVFLTILIALLGGLAMGSVVAARRTQSAYGAFLARDHASTLTLSTYGLYNGSPANDYSPHLEQAIRRLPEVAQVESWIETYLVPIGRDGAPAGAVIHGAVNVAGSVDGALFDEDRVTVVRGRIADRGDPNEFMASEAGARLLGIHLGQSMQFGAFNSSLIAQPGFGTAAVQPTRRFPMRLVGIIEFNNGIVQDDTDRTPTNLVITPAAVRTQGTTANGTWFAVRLKPGVKDLGRVEQEMLRLLPAGALGQFYLTSVTEAKVESALRPESIAVGTFGLIAGLAALGLCLPILARLKVNSDDERDVLQALGATRSVIVMDYCLGITACVLLGTALAGVVSAALATLAPLGPVHAVYRPESLAIDWTVTALGALSLSAILIGAAVVMALHGVTRRSRATSRRTPQPSHAVDLAATAGLPVPAVIGARFALERGHGRTSVANRSVLVGGILSVTLVVATLTFASGLRTLVGHPALYGWNWDHTLIGYSNVPPAALDALTRDPDVAAWSGYIAITTTVDGRSVPVLIATNGLDVTPPLVAGHRITGRGQIVLGAATLATLHKRIGDTVLVGLGSPRTAPLYLPPQPLRIVGAATFPAVAGSSNFADHTSMGVGGLFSFASLPSAFVQQTRNPDPVQNGPALVFVRYRPGSSASAASNDLRRIVAIAARQFARDPAAAGAGISVLPVQRPAAIVNYQSTGQTPLVLALGLAVAATVALALSMTASVRRRRRDLAVLKTLGFIRRQMLATVTAQALVTAVLAVAVGVPLGIAAGRQLWVAFARSIYAVPKPTVPLSVAWAAASAIAVAVAVAVVPGRVAARTPAAVELNAD